MAASRVQPDSRGVIIGDELGNSLSIGISLNAGINSFITWIRGHRQVLVWILIVSMWAVGGVMIMNIRLTEQRSGVPTFPAIYVGLGIIFCSFLIKYGRIYGNQAITFDFSSIFWGMGAVFGLPWQVLISGLIGRLISSYFLDTQFFKRVFNVSTHIFIGLIMIWIFQSLNINAHFLSSYAIFGYFTMQITTLFSGFFIVIAIFFYTGRVKAKELFRIWLFSIPLEFICAILGTIAIVCYFVSPLLCASLLVPITWMMFMSNDFSLKEQQSQNLLELHTITEKLLIGKDIRDATAEYLSLLARLFMAEYVELILFEKAESDGNKNDISIGVELYRDNFKLTGGNEEDDDSLHELIGVIGNGKPLDFDGCDKEEVIQFKKKRGIRSGVAIKLGANEKELGVVIIGNFTNVRPSKVIKSNRLVLIRNLAAQTVIALERSQIAEELRQSTTEQKILLKRALSDSLTQVGNRDLFMERLTQAVASLQRFKERIGVIFLDLDGFKEVNDGMGHLAGDEVLRVVGRRLAGLTRPYDTVARLGGDEFALLLTRLPDETLALEVAERVAVAIREEINTQTGKARIRASVGVVTTIDANINVEDLLRAADIAMYKGKEKGKDQIVVGIL